MPILTFAANPQPINLAHPPKPNAIVLWEHQGVKYKASFRNACHMEWLNNEAKRVFGVEIHVFQPCYHTGYAPSAGTHDEGECWDLSIPGVSWDKVNHFFRLRAFAGWVRTPAQGFTYHYHGFTLPPAEGVVVSDNFRMAGFPVGIYVDGGYTKYGHLTTSSQIADYYAHAFGLANHHTANSDKSWYPDDINATIFNLDHWLAAMTGKPAAPAKPPVKDPAPTKPPVKRKTIAQIAAEVINARWGDGDVRIARLRKAGYDPVKVQAAVNTILSGKPTKPTKPPVHVPVPTHQGALPVDGVDISHYQDGTLGYAAAKKAGVKWMYHKATEGTTYRDPNFAKRRAEAKKAGLPFGGYHFARPSAAHGSAVAQAQFFLRTIDPQPGDVLPMLDIEDAGGMSMSAVAVWVAAFSGFVEHVLGHKPLIYTQSSWDLGPIEHTHVMWRARYSNSNIAPARPYDIWQFSDGTYGNPRAVSGFGNVDLSTMRKGLSLDSLMLPVKAAAPAKPPKAPTKPAKPPKAPAKPAKVSTYFDFNVMTQNVCELPQMSQDKVVADVTATGKDTGPGGVIGWQEIGLYRYKQAVAALPRFITYWGQGKPGNLPARITDAYDSCISWDPHEWIFVGGGRWLLHKGKAKVCADRWATWVRLHNVKTCNIVLFLNTHLVAQPFTTSHPVDQRELRQEMWHAGVAAINKFADDMHAKNPSDDMILLGDYNANHRRDHAEFTVIDAKFKSAVPPTSIDQVFVDESLVVKSIKTCTGRNSDHQGRRATVGF